MAVNEQIPDDYSSAEGFSRDYRRTTNMSLVTLPRYQTLWSNDPDVVKSFSGPDYMSLKHEKTLFHGVADHILAFGRLIFDSSDDPTSAIGSDVMPTATECALHWCVQTLDTTIQNGVLNQTIARTWSNTSALDTSDVNLSPDTSGPNYYVSPMSNVPLVRFLQDAFNATVQRIYLPDFEFTPDQQLDLTIYSSDIAQALWHADDLHLLMSKLAHRMTDALRNLYSDPVLTDPSLLGDVYTTQTYVHVSWPWLILPVALVMASCAVLLAAVVESWRCGTVPWKSSSLAVLFHGIGSKGEGNVGDLMYKREMEERAEGMKVRLVEGKGGMVRLMEVENTSGMEAVGSCERARTELLGLRKG